MDGPASEVELSLVPYRKVDVRRHGKGNSNFRGARPVHLITTTVRWVWTSRLSVENYLSALPRSKKDVLPLLSLESPPNLIRHGTQIEYDLTNENYYTYFYGPDV